MQCHLGKNLRQLGGEAVKRQCEPRPFFFFFSLFVYFGLHWAFSVAVSRGYSLVPMQGFLITGASLVWSISSRCLGSVVAAHRVQSTGSVLDHHRSPFSYFLNS